MGLERTKVEIVNVMASTSLIAQRYTSSELKELYRNNMFELCEKVRSEFIDTLKK